MPFAPLPVSVFNSVSAVFTRPLSGLLLAKVLAPIALLADSARFNSSVPQVDHAVIGEEADEPGDIEDAALRRVVGLPDDCFTVVRDLALLIRLALIRLRACGTEDSELRSSNADCRNTKECAPSKITFFEHMSFSPNGVDEVACAETRSWPLSRLAGVIPSSACLQ